MEAGRLDAGAGLILGNDCRNWLARRETRIDEIRPAVWDVSRARRRRLSRGRRSHRRVVPRILRMTPAGQAFLGLTAIVTALVAVLTFTVLRFLSAARQAR